MAFKPYTIQELSKMTAAELKTAERDAECEADRVQEWKRQKIGKILFLQNLIEKEKEEMRV